MDDWKVYQLLHSMGITMDYKGFRQTIVAVQLALEDEKRLNHVTKEIYWKVADETGCSPSSVEKDIRTVILRAWENNPVLLQKLAGRPLSSVPTVSRFLSDLTVYFKIQEMKKRNRSGQ